MADAHFLRILRVRLSATRACMRVAAPLALLGLMGCADVRESVSAARWIQPDSSVVYLTSYQIWENSLLGSAPRSESLRLYTTRFNESGLEPGKLILEIEEGQLCDNVLYRAADSLLYFEFVTQSGCIPGKIKLWAGVLRNGRFVERVTRDTAGLRAQLSDSGSKEEPGLYISSDGKALCIASGCYPHKGDPYD
jgi:hypothetical protein